MEGFKRDSRQHLSAGLERRHGVGSIFREERGNINTTRLVWPVWLEWQRLLECCWR